MLKLIPYVMVNYFLLVIIFENVINTGFSNAKCLVIYLDCVCMNCNRIFQEKMDLVLSEICPSQ